MADYCCGGANRLAIVGGFALATFALIFAVLAINFPVAKDDVSFVTLFKTCEKACLEKEKENKDDGGEGVNPEENPEDTYAEGLIRARRDGDNSYEGSIALEEMHQLLMSLGDDEAVRRRRENQECCPKHKDDGGLYKSEPDMEKRYQALSAIVFSSIISHAVCMVMLTLMCVMCCTLLEKIWNVIHIIVAILALLISAAVPVFMAVSCMPKSANGKMSPGAAFYTFIGAAVLSLGHTIASIVLFASYKKEDERKPIIGDRSSQAGEKKQSVAQQAAPAEG